MFMIVLVLEDPYHCNNLLQAWRDAGVSGATILESRGLGKSFRGARDDVPLLPSLDDIVQKDEQRHRTVFSVVPDRDTLDRVREVTRSIIGPFGQKNSGFMFVLPVVEAYGLE